MGKSTIEVERYSFVYEGTGKKVLEDVPFTTEEGDFTGIIGCNEAGKTTLYQSMVGILSSIMGSDWDGNITVDGRNLNDSNGKGVADIIGVIFQGAESRFIQETVEDELAFIMCNFGYERKVIRERILYALKACSLEDMLNHSSLELSDGQQQRLAIACILALQPRVIILDGSTSQLDPLRRDKVFQLVTKLRARGTTVIMAGHNIEKIAEYADEVLVLHEGEMVVYDDTHKVSQQKELLREHFVRVLQVTEAALRTEEQLGINEAPIELGTAEKMFAPLRGGMGWREP